MGGSCNSTMGLRDGVEECDNGGSREQDATVDNGDVAEIVGSKGKGMGISLFLPKHHLLIHKNSIPNSLNNTSLKTSIYRLQKT
jgi:hypothetical protein